MPLFFSKIESGSLTENVLTLQSNVWVILIFALSIVHFVDI